MVNLLTVIDKSGVIHRNVNQKIFTSPEAAATAFGFQTIAEMSAAQAEATRKIVTSSDHQEATAA